MLKNAHTVELLRIAKSEALFAGDFESTLQAITEGAARALDVQRVGIWFYDDTRTSIRCADLFESPKGVHSTGLELFAQDYPSYFRALEENRVIDAHDAHTDPRTCEFSASYLDTLGIGAMLDAPIRVRGEMVGVVCNEYLGAARQWSAEEAAFGGSMADFVALAREVRDRILAEDALRQEVSARVRRERLAALGEMSAVVAHEVRNPIGAIYNSVSLLRRMVDCTDDVKALLAVLEEESQRLIDLTDNLLDVARPVDARLDTCDLVPVVERAVTVVRRQPRYAERELLIDLHLPAVGLSIFSDANLLHRVIVNLVTNAVEATPLGSRVGISVRAVGDGTASIAFTNPGEPLPPEQASRIFEPFFTTKAVGSGLGLAIVRQLMTTLRGRVDFHCEDAEITFTIFLPTSDKRSASMPPGAL